MYVIVCYCMLLYCAKRGALQSTTSTRHVYLYFVSELHCLLFQITRYRHKAFRGDLENALSTGSSLFVEEVSEDIDLTFIERIDRYDIH